MRSRLGPERISERRACRVLGQPRNTQRYQSQGADDEPGLLREMRSLARQRPRFGSERIYRLLTQRGWTVNEKRVHRLWKREHMQARENNIASDDSLAEVRMVAWVTVPDTRIMCGRTIL